MLQTSKITINIERLKLRLLELGSTINSHHVGYNRVAFSEYEKEALGWLKQKMNELNMNVYQDPIGNVFGTYGKENKPVIAVGSHLDTVIEGGLYDGALGVLVGLECIETLIEHGYTPNIPLQLIAFIAEEANPMGGTFGSRAVAGMLNKDNSLEEGLKSVNLSWDDCESSIQSTDKFVSFIELHIEQGAILENENKKIGIVESIAGILRLGVSIKGDARHAGTTPMSHRNDALVNATNLIHYLNTAIQNYEESMVVTVGELHVYPNLASVVPGEVNLTIEIRGSDWKKMKSFEQAIREWLNQHLEANVELKVEKLPNDLDNSLQLIVEDVCVKENIPYRYMVSGANHDSKSMATLTKAGLIFIPSKDGISHHPDEFSSWEDIEIGANVLLKTLIHLSK